MWRMDGYTQQVDRLKITQAHRTSLYVVLTLRFRHHQHHNVALPYTWFSPSASTIINKPSSEHRRWKNQILERPPFGTALQTNHQKENIYLR